MADHEPPDDVAPEAADAEPIDTEADGEDATADTWRSFLDGWTPPADDDEDDPYAPDPDEDEEDDLDDEDLDDDEHETDHEAPEDEDDMPNEDKAALDAYKALGDPKEIASTLEAYKGLGDPKTLAKALEEREAATKELAKVAREKEITAVAEAHKFKAPALTKLAGAHEFVGKEVKDPKTGKTSTVYHVKAGDKTVPIEEHEDFAPFLDSLRSAPQAAMHRGTPPGAGGQPRPQIVADGAKALPSLVR